MNKNQIFSIIYFVRDAIRKIAVPIKHLSMQMVNVISTKERHSCSPQCHPLSPQRHSQLDWESPAFITSLN